MSVVRRSDLKARKRRIKGRERGRVSRQGGSRKRNIV
jgi:hypothetical protein